METSALRQRLLTKLGNFPQQVALVPGIGVPIDEGEYSRVLITYEVAEGERIAAWLLKPAGLYCFCACSKIAATD